jgi:hypothetical protein
MQSTVMRSEMKTEQLISPDRLCNVNLATEKHWIRLGLHLAQEFTGGDLVWFADDATVSIKGTDKLSLSYKRTNWVSGIASGALHAFRTLRIPRQCLVVTELSGRLRAFDMDAVANSSAIAIAKLANKELPSLPTEGWTIHTEVLEQQLAGLTPTATEETAASASRMARSRTNQLSDAELAILGELLDKMLRGGETWLLDHDMTGFDKRGVDPEEYVHALEITIGVRPRNLDAVVVRRLMGSIISQWIKLKASLGLIPTGEVDLAIHLAAAQFANAFPVKGEASPEREQEMPS